MTSRSSIAVAAALVAALVLPAAAAPPQPPAQQPSGPPNALQGFSQNRDQPVKIDSATLEVRDKEKIATFSGSVHLVQGDTVLRCKTLVVFYDQPDTTGSIAKTSSVGPSGTQQIRRMEAKGGVVVTQKDQTATGDNGVYDMPANTVTLIGSVVVTQGQNIIKGERLVVDLTTGISHVEGRVSGLLIPNNPPKVESPSKPAPETKAADKKAAPPAPAPKQQQRPLHPSSIY
jgi:lipopolysaccharide export system protein LptA